MQFTARLASHLDACRQHLAALIDRRPLLACLLAGVLLAFALPPYGIFPLIFIALPILCRSLSTASVRAAFWRGLLFAFGMLAGSLYWIANSMFVDLASFWWAIPLAVAGLPFYLSLYTGAATALYVALQRRFVFSPTAGVILLALLLNLAEVARSTILTGFAWNLFGQVWQHAPTMLQSLSLIGIYGLSLLTWLLALSPVLVFNARRSSQLAGVLILLTVLSLDLWGAHRLSRAGDPTEQAMVEGVRLRLVQPAIPQNLKANPAAHEANFETTLDLSALPTTMPKTLAKALRLDATDTTAPTHIIWPEAAVPFLLERDEDARLAIGARTPEDGLTILGAPTKRFTEDGTHEWGNSIVTVDSIGALRQIYDKGHLVPFGEYFPLRAPLAKIGISVNAIAAGSSDFTPGPGPMAITLKGLPPVSPSVCYEIIFPGHVAPRAYEGMRWLAGGMAGDRPGWLLNVTNDGWFGDSIGPYQHFEIARLRAIEEGLPLIRVANTGISGVIDPYGRVLAQTAMNARTVLDTGLPVSLPPTLFSRVTELPYLFMLMACGLLILRLHNRRHS